MDFSFIIPVYNCKDHLRSCVDSILACRVASMEIILVDDGSTDGTALLCDTLVREDSRIRVIHQENAGVSTARNAGIAAATGNHILFIDSDDAVDSIELTHILTDPNCNFVDWVFFGIRFDYFRNGSLYHSDPIFYPFDGIMQPLEWGAALQALFLSNTLSSSCTKVFRRDIILNNHLTLNTDMFLYEDMEFVLRYLACCDTIWNVPKAVYHYRQSEDEGNAGRRLARIDSISGFLKPIEEAFRNLCDAHSHIAPGDCEAILQKLYLVLAREKIADSDTAGIRKICREYALWEKKTVSAPEPSPFRDRLLGEQVFSIRFHRLKSKLRHRLAVTVKSFLHRIR